MIFFSDLLIWMLVLGSCGFGVILWVGYRYYQRKSRKQAVSSILKASSMPTFRQTLPQLSKEIARVRRYQRPISIIVIKSDSTASPEEYHAIAMNHQRISRIEFIICGRIFQDTIREIDIIAYDDVRDQFIVILPESNKSQAFQATKRLRNSLDKKIADQLVMGIAELPADGLILDDLVEHARKNPVDPDHEPLCKQTV